MIRRISGEIVEIFDESIAVRTGAGICYEALVGTYALPELQALMDAREPVELHTHHYLEGNAASGQSLIPRLVGFLTPAERDFFLRFINVFCCSLMFSYFGHKNHILFGSHKL